MTTKTSVDKNRINDLVLEHHREVNPHMYPINSTARQFFDIDGNPCTLSQLIRSEPDWARSRIIELEKRVAELESKL